MPVRDRQLPALSVAQGWAQALPSGGRDILSFAVSHKRCYVWCCAGHIEVYRSGIFQLHSIVDFSFSCWIERDFWYLSRIGLPTNLESIHIHIYHIYIYHIHISYVQRISRESPCPVSRAHELMSTSAPGPDGLAHVQPVLSKMTKENC